MKGPFAVLSTFAAMALLSSSVHAACGVKLCSGKIVRTFTSTTATYVQMDQDLSPLNCTAQCNVYLTLELNHPNYDAVYALLLAGHTRESSQMRVRNTEGIGNCKISYVTSDIYRDEAVDDAAAGLA